MRKRNASEPVHAARLPALDLLVGFESAARHLSFTKAGEELFLTQSAVSRQIKDLEEQLGAALFERRHRALSLTEAGQQFYASAAQILAKYKLRKSEAADVARYVIDVIGRDQKSRRSASHKKAVTKKAR